MQKIEYVIAGLLIVCVDIILSGVCYMMYLAQHKILAICFIPLIVFGFIIGLYATYLGLKK